MGFRVQLEALRQTGSQQRAQRRESVGPEPILVLSPRMVPREQHSPSSSWRGTRLCPSVSPASALLACCHEWGLTEQGPGKCLL